MSPELSGSYVLCPWNSVIPSLLPHHIAVSIRASHPIAVNLPGQLAPRYIIEA